MFFALEALAGEAVRYGNPVWKLDAPDPTVWLFFGPGHNGEIFTTPSGSSYMFYHCHWSKSPDRRSISSHR